jgi:DNA-binding response OmpR family regulator
MQLHEACPKLVSPRRVLVVDDYVDAAETTAMLLEMLGHQARAVTCGRAVAGAVASFDPDIVILDIGLPDLNGYEVAREVRKNFGPRPYLAAVTGWSHADARRRIADAGFDLHVVKPTDLAKLRAILCEHRRAA